MMTCINNRNILVIFVQNMQCGTDPLRRVGGMVRYIDVTLPEEYYSGPQNALVVSLFYKSEKFTLHSFYNCSFRQCIIMYASIRNLS